MSEDDSTVSADVRQIGLSERDRASHVMVEFAVSRTIADAAKILRKHGWTATEIADVFDRPQDQIDRMFEALETRP